MKFIIIKDQYGYSLIFENKQDELEVGEWRVSYNEVKKWLWEWSVHDCVKDNEKQCSKFKKGGVVWKKSALDTRRLRKIFKDVKDKQITKPEDSLDEII